MTSIPDMTAAELHRWLDARAEPLDRQEAQATRDRIAGLLASDPREAHTLAGAFRRCVERVQDDVDPFALAMAWRSAGEALAFMGRFKRASDAYARSVDIANAAHEERLLGQTLVGWTGVLGLVGRLDEARRRAEQARRLLTRARDDVYLGKLAGVQGSNAYHAERYDEAFDWYRVAADALGRLDGHDETRVSLLINQAVACTKLLRLRDARALFLEAERLARRLGLERFVGLSELDRAHLQRLGGDFRSALELLESSRAHFGSQGASDLVAATERERAHVYLELSMAAEAIEHARLAAEQFARDGLDLDAALSRVLIARAHLIAGEPTLALERLAEPWAYFRGQRMAPRAASAALLAARARLMLGDPSTAIRHARRALRSMHRRDVDSIGAEGHRLIAIGHVMAGRLTRAERAVDEALARAASASPGDRGRIWSLAGRIARARGEHAEAGRRLRRAVREVERQLQLIPGIEYRSRAFEDHVRAYHDLIDVLSAGRRTSATRLYALFERARGRAHRERLHRSDPIGGDADDAALAEERAVLGALTQRLQDLEHEGAASDVREPVQRDIRRTERRIAELMRRRDARRSSGTGGADAHSLDLVMETLGPTDAAILYFETDERIVAICARRDRCAWRVLEIAPGDVHRLLGENRFQLDTMAMVGDGVVDLDFMTRSSLSTLGPLYDGLVRPFEDELADVAHLHLVPHRSLHHVPFECLHDGYVYVESRWHLSRLPTADVLAIARRRRPLARVLVAGTVRNTPVHVASEVAAVSDSLAGVADTTVDVRLDPSSSELVRELPGYDLVHLATHGVFREDNPLFSRLSTTDGALFMADVLDLRMRADLVVLSACNTGQVFSGRGDDLSGVAHAFLASGVRQLVASNWRVHDESTLALMSAFHRGYAAADRRDPLEALRSARREVRDRWDHPFYWGAFAVHGT